MAARQLAYFLCTRDVPSLFSNFERKRMPPVALPPYALVNVVPLVDMTRELGPTQFLLRSHVPCRHSQLVNVTLPFSQADNKFQDKQECPEATVTREGKRTS